MKTGWKRYWSDRQREVAFTRMDSVALLAAVFVIAAVLVPGVASPRTSSHKLVCFENMRRIAQANVMFAEDIEGFLPYPGWGGLGQGSRTNWLYTFHPRAVNGTQRVIEEGQIWPYLRERSVYLCPSEETNTALFLARDVRISSYIMNGAVSDFSDGVGGVGGATYLLSQFAPAAVAFWEPDEQTPFNFNDGSARPDAARISVRHGTGIVGTFGGGADYISYQEYERQVGTSSTEGGIRPGRFWCNPGSPTGDQAR